jgi:neurotransmitter:Na+ symporter, NSS family
MPAGGLLVALIAGWALPAAASRRELGMGAAAFALWRVLIRYLVPLAIIVIFLSIR